MTNIIEDMSKIHEETDLRLSDIDDKINKSIALVSQGEIAPMPALEELRIELWLGYTEENIGQIEKLLGELSRRLVKVGDKKSQLNEIKRSFERVKKECNDHALLVKNNKLPKLVELFNKSTKLWNNIADNEEDLRREAWFKFISWIYLPSASVLSIAFWAYFKAQFGLDVSNSLFYWVVGLVVLYFGLLKWAKNPFGVYDEEVKS